MSISIERSSVAYLTLVKNLDDIHKLLIFKLNKNFKGIIMGISNDKDTLRRASIILLVTAFETFVEDKLKKSFVNRVNKITKPEEISLIFGNVVIPWLYQTGQKKPHEIYKLTGDNWKKIILESFEKEIQRLNTPDSKTLISLYKKYLNTALELLLLWKGMSFEKICKKLDMIIKLRGDVTHRSKKLFERKTILTEKQLLDYIEFILRVSKILEKVK